ncbi:MAG: hypothetical protein VB055_04530 [Oscillospiraceae bacterium]|nr:hypothetical protein [Oscillospiraceae bacterium]
MVLDVILAVLAAMGIVLIAWCLVGLFLLPADGAGYCIFYYRGARDRKRVLAYLFLLRGGLTRLPLYVVDRGMTPEERAEFRRLEESPDFCVLDEESLNKFREMERDGRVFGA